MKEIKILSVTWKQVEAVGTKKEFDQGKPQFVFTPIIKCVLTNDFPVFERNSHPGTFFVHERKIVAIQMIGYHIGNSEITFGTYLTYEKEFEIKKIFSC